MLEPKTPYASSEKKPPRLDAQGEFKLPITPIGLNEQIKNNALLDTEWRHHADVKWLYQIGDLLNEHFFDGDIPQVVIGLDETGRLKKSGEFYFEGDGVSLRNHIDLKKGLTRLEQVMALVHNYVHAHNESYGTTKSWYHSTTFRKAMKEFGLQTDKSGDLIAIDIPKFSGILEKVGAKPLVIELQSMFIGAEPEPTIPPIIEPKIKGTGEPANCQHYTVDQGCPMHGETCVMEASPSALSIAAANMPPSSHIGGPGGTPSTFTAWDEAKQAIEAEAGNTDLGSMIASPNAPVAGSPVASVKPKSKMIKWGCGCTNVRCAVTLEAQCLKCGGKYVITDKNIVGG